MSRSFGGTRLRAVLIAAALNLTGAGGAIAQVAFDYEQKPLPLGAGLPEGRSFDIAGLYAGQTAADALKVMTDFYAARKEHKPYVGTGQREFTAAPYTDELVGFMGARAYDWLIAGFTSPASGNQAAFVKREVRYAAGSEPGFADTLAAIKAKYGEPSYERDAGVNGGRWLMYTFLGGEQKTGLQCLFMTENLRNYGPQHSNLDSFIAKTVYANMGQYDDADRCDFFFDVTLKPGFENGAYNQNTVGSMQMMLVDAGRYEYGLHRDEEVQKDYEAARDAQAPTGNGAAKL